MSGHTANSATRSIVADTWSGRLLSLTLLHEPFHGVHHLRVRTAASRNCRCTPTLLAPAVEGEIAPFPNYRSALMASAAQSADPRVGQPLARLETDTIR